MARAWIEDTWFSPSPHGSGRKVRTARHGRGLQWRVRWYDDRRRTRARPFRTKREAEAWQSLVEHELREASYRDRTLGQVPFAEVAVEWLTTRTDITPSTRLTYSSTLDRHVLPRWGSVAVARVRRQDLAIWLAGLGEGLAPRTIVGIHRVVSMVLSWAVETDRIGVNPAARLPLPRAVDFEHVYLTHAEVERLADATGAYRPMVLTLAYTGLRFGECAALQVRSVDIPQLRLHVTQAWVGLNTGLPYLSLPKTHERRKVGLPSFLVAELEPFLVGRTSTEWLFEAPHGGVLNISNWNNRIFAPALRRADLAGRGITTHSLRHTAASLAIAAGADVKVVQNMLGPKDAAMTLNTYAGLFPDRLDTVADALDVARHAALMRQE